MGGAEEWTVPFVSPAACKQAPRSFVAALHMLAIASLISWLAGAVTMLLLAPQSGKDTRKQIQEKSRELRDRTTELMEDTMAQVRTKANNLTVSLKDRGQEIAVKELDLLSDAAQSREASNLES